MLKAVIFDMDGVLIDSEPLWTQAEMEEFAKVGLQLTEADCRQTVGLGLENVVKLRFKQKPWTQPSQQDVANRIHARMDELISQKGKLMPGVEHALGFFKSKNLKIGLASGSDPKLISTALAKLQIKNHFDHIQSASELKYSKPHPEVYLRAVKLLGVSAETCLAIEDSIPGVVSAKAAKMKVIAVPDSHSAKDPRFSLADIVLNSLDLMSDKYWEMLTNNTHNSFI